MLAKNPINNCQYCYKKWLKVHSDVKIEEYVQWKKMDISYGGIKVNKLMKIFPLLNSERIK